MYTVKINHKKLTINLVNFFKLIFKLIIEGWNYANKAIFNFAVLVKKYGKDIVINTVNKITNDIEIKK
ncbi:hypothetical protein [Spiroplasma endosymbiont of Polydrusus cervinus]|uniref:hypothetical protein n=1 Tax=Spiroplasma endosymbiont of Polydrusus cervinus TaxID=3066287 RepID=UPI0030D2137E